MAHECVEPPNFNGLAKLMGVSIFDDADFKTAGPSTTSDAKRVPTVDELAQRYMLPVNTAFLGITPRAGGWGYPIDDPYAGAVTRIKALPGLYIPG